MQPETKTRSPALMACEYGPIAAGAFSVVTGLKEEWVVTAVDIVRVTCAAEETLSAIKNLRLDDLGTMLLRQRRAPDFDSCCNIDGLGQNVRSRGRNVPYSQSFVVHNISSYATVWTQNIFSRDLLRDPYMGNSADDSNHWTDDHHHHSARPPLHYTPEI